ncbi:reactive chlorine-specific transcriptional regulator RclR, partial [Salmonella enterica subsp. enterica serovar Infantis]
DAMILTPGKVVILPQNSSHRLRQSGEAPKHIVCGSLRLHTTSRYFLTAMPEVLCLAPPPHSPARICLNAAIMLLQQESE